MLMGVYSWPLERLLTARGLCGAQTRFHKSKGRIFWQAQQTASASLLNWEYFFSTLLSLRLAQHTDLEEPPSCCCSTTAPRQTGDVSGTRRVSASLAKWAMTGAFFSNFLICSKASSSLVSHFQDLPVLVRSHKRLDIVENPGMDFAQNWADPRKLLTSDGFWGLGASTTASTLLLEICSPSPVSDSPMYSMLLARMTLFIVKGQPMHFKLAHYFVKVFIMLPVVTANYSYIVMQVVSTGGILQYLPY